jgi:hypothetical protein
MRLIVRVIKLALLLSEKVSATMQNVFYALFPIFGGPLIISTLSKMPATPMPPPPRMAINP